MAKNPFKLPKEDRLPIDSSLSPSHLLKPLKVESEDDAEAKRERFRRLAGYLRSSKSSF